MCGWLCRELLKTEERLNELNRAILACESEVESVQAIAESAGGSAIPQLKNRDAAPGFLSPEYLENARKFMSFIQNDITAASTRRNEISRERKGLWSTICLPLAYCSLYTYLHDVLLLLCVE